jgi:4-hydroxy-4-methyl-2-oxoglutarate aldolase
MDNHFEWTGEIMEKASYQFSTPVLANASERVLGPWTPRQMILDGLVSLRKDDKATGRAYTIRLRRSSKPSRANAARTLAAYDAAPADSIVFIQLGDDLGGAVVGDIIAHRLKKLKVAGVVVEGPVRDIDGLIQFGPPIWYRNAVASGLELAETEVEVQVALQLGTALVEPGSIISIDRDGVFVFPGTHYEALVSQADTITAKETLVHAALENNETLLRVLNLDDEITP